MMGFTFNGAHSDEFGLIVKTIQPPAPPKPRYTNVKVIGRDGEYKFPDGYEDIKIELDIFIKGSISARRAIRRQIGAWLQGEGILVMDYDPEEAYECTITDVTTKEFKARHEVVSVLFECRIF